MLTKLGKKAKASLQRMYGKTKGTNKFYSNIKTRKRMGYVDGYQIGKPKKRPKVPYAIRQRAAGKVGW